MWGAAACSPALPQPLFPERPLLKHFLSQQRRSCWRDALSVLIQPSVRAQSSIHFCHILILSLRSASGCPVKELTVWGVKRDRDWYTEIHLQIHTGTLKHLPTRTYICIYTHTKSLFMLAFRHPDTPYCCSPFPRRTHKVQSYRLNFTACCSPLSSTLWRFWITTKHKVRLVLIMSVVVSAFGW